MFKANCPRWIARAEKFFEVYYKKAAKKLQPTFISMDGPTVHWFQFMRNKMSELTWEGLTKALFQRFEGRSLGNVYERLTTLCQLTTMEDYVQDFEVLVA